MRISEDEAHTSLIRENITRRLTKWSSVDKSPMQPIKSHCPHVWTGDFIGLRFFFFFDHNAAGKPDL